MMSSSYLEITDALTALTHILKRYSPIWAYEPFQQPASLLSGISGWPLTYSALYDYLVRLTDAEVAQLESQPDALHNALSSYLPELDIISHIEADIVKGTQAPPQSTTTPLPNRFSNGINGRKWQQIQAFCAQLSPAKHYIDWCCGKGHLARTLNALYGSEVSGLEWDSTLCEAGNTLAKKQHQAVTIYPYDVLSEAPLPKFQYVAHPSSVHYVALHACGDLHIKAIDAAINNEATHLSIAPCCFHKTQHAIYQPYSKGLSKVMMSQSLQVTRSQLKLAVQETVTAPSRDQQQRHTLKLWRLAFLRIRQQQDQSNDYLPSPSVSPKLLQQGFKGFCAHLADQCDIKLPTHIQYQDALNQAATELKIVERLELARHAFRRGLELWLVLDRALYLQEHKYDVSISQFCDRRLTPRNLLLQAKLNKARLNKARLNKARLNKDT